MGEVSGRSNQRIALFFVVGAKIFNPAMNVRHGVDTRHCDFADDLFRAIELSDASGPRNTVSASFDFDSVRREDGW